MALSEDTMAKCAEHLDAYKTACEDDPDLKSFDSSLQERAIKMIDTVTAAAEAGTGFVSQHEIHMEVSQHLAEVSQEVAKFILESEDDVWENKPLRSLVMAYFDNTRKTIEIFENVMVCVEKAELGQNYILEAVAQFDNESAEKDLGVRKKRYEKTLKELKKFKAMGDPFAGSELNTQFKLIKEQQESLLREVSETKQKIDEELNRVSHQLDSKKDWKRSSTVIFGATGFGAFVASVAVLASGGAALVPIALAGGLFLGIVPVWISVDTFLKKRIDALKKQQEDLKKLNDKLSSVEIGAQKEMVFDKEVSGSISGLVEGLENKISFILKYVDDAIDSEGDEVDMKLDLERLRDKVEKLTEKIKELGESVDKRSKSIREVRFQIMEKINKINGSGKYHRG